MRPTLPALSSIDQLINGVDRALRAMFVTPSSQRPCPQANVIDNSSWTDQDKRHAAALMRVNHVGEVCAQALYQAQALTARSPAVAQALEQAAREEADHLAWTKQRIDALGGRTSLLNPVWYAGAFGLGLIAGRLGDAVSLGFVVETERQVEAHLDGHLQQLPAQDHESRAILEQMRRDEIAHGDAAERLGGVRPPAAVRQLMQGMAKIMTTLAYRI